MKLPTLIPTVGLRFLGFESESYAGVLTRVEYFRAGSHQCVALVFDESVCIVVGYARDAVVAVRRAIDYYPDDYYHTVRVLQSLADCYRVLPATHPLDLVFLPHEIVDGLRNGIGLRYLIDVVFDDTNNAARAEYTFTPNRD